VTITPMFEGDIVLLRESYGVDARGATRTFHQDYILVELNNGDVFSWWYRPWVCGEPVPCPIVDAL